MCDWLQVYLPCDCVQIQLLKHSKINFTLLFCWTENHIFRKKRDSFCLTTRKRTNKNIEYVVTQRKIIIMSLSGSMFDYLVSQFISNIMYAWYIEKKSNNSLLFKDNLSYFFTYLYYKKKLSVCLYVTKHLENSINKISQIFLFYLHIT